MRLTLMEFLTLDGVSQGPGSPDEDTSDGFTQGGWFVPHLDEEFVQQAVDWLGPGGRFAVRPPHLRQLFARLAPDDGPR